MHNSKDISNCQYTLYLIYLKKKWCMFCWVIRSFVWQSKEPFRSRMSGFFLVSWAKWSDSLKKIRHSHHCCCWLATPGRKFVSPVAPFLTEAQARTHSHAHTDPHSRPISRVWTILDCTVILSDHRAPGSLPACAFRRLKIRLVFICSKRDKFLNSWAAASATSAASPDCCTHKVTQKAA